MRAGESIQSIRASSPLTKASTTSLPALRSHATGLAAFYEGDFARSASLYENAIRLDSTFADAYVSLSVALNALGAKPARQIEALIKAYEFRDRLVEAERFGVEANYLFHVKGDRQAAIDAFRNYTKLDRRNAYWAGLASLLIQSKQYTEAERTLTEGFEHQTTPAMFYHLARARFGQGRTADADRAFVEGARRFPANPIFARAQIEFAAGTGNYALADSLAHSFVAGNPSTPLVHQALVDAALERTPEVLDHLHALRQSQLSSGSVPGSFLTLLMMARLRLHGAGDTTAAVNEIESALRRREFSAIDLRERPYAVLAHFFVEAGRYARGREWASATPPSQFPGVIRRHRP